MAANTGARKRDPIKHIRDKAKAAYIKQPYCHICGTSEALELHHTHSLTNLFEKWAKETGHIIEDDEDVIEIREEFIDQHRAEIYDDVYTLCLKHHQLLHSIYGKAPALHTAKKQSVWINNQKDKFNGLVSKEGLEPNPREVKSSAAVHSDGIWTKYRIRTDFNSFTSLRTV